MTNDYSFLKDHSYSLPPSNGCDEKTKPPQRLRRQIKSAVSTSSSFRSMSVDRNSSDKENTSLSFLTTSAATNNNSDPTPVTARSKRIRSSNRTPSSIAYLDNEHLTPNKRQRNKSSTLSSNNKKNIQTRASTRIITSKPNISRDYYRQRHNSPRKKVKTTISKVDKQQPTPTGITNKKKSGNNENNQNWTKILGFKPDDPSSPSLSIEERVKLRHITSSAVEHKLLKTSSLSSVNHTRSNILSTNDFQKQTTENKQKQKNSTGDLHSHLSRSNASVNQDLKQIRQAMANITVTKQSNQQLKKRKSTRPVLVTTSSTVLSKKQRSSKGKKSMHDKQMIVEEVPPRVTTTSTKLFLSSGLDLNNIILGNRERRSTGNGSD
ncbi:unnamed protein product [Didymodactylos carnosus]|uniref:Uncharacterized protein n=1 Tax=Didymodactylos carnosus TaxID=1234261 RepID=A0A814BKF7_9BILA|nr:unnamed protein product [Didymodactylos carnosus]CAF0928729.1 unnamed protein product [Didymodactylos carnosus]CAF3523466.1 unnamed protein product [Didymodactylos carnosus]CAF3707051.1 unnamed protein product [Didymodactylos carnosus]